MDTEALKPILAGVVRHALTTAGGALVAGGYMQSSQTADFIGGGMVVAGVLWSWWQKEGQAEVGELLKKITAQKTVKNAVSAAEVLPPKAAVDTAVKAASVSSVVAKVLIAAFLLSAFLAGDARAQTKLGPIGTKIKTDIEGGAPPAATPAPAGSVDAAVSNFNSGIQKITKDIVDKAIADVTAAQTDAQNHNDQISKPCWDANLSLLKSLPSQWENPPPSPLGIALGIQIQRDLLNAITGNDTTSLKVACAALWGDQIKIVGQLGALLGVRIATGGLF